MMTAAAVTLGLALLLAQGPGAAAAANLSEVKQLYASAAYEEALARLSVLEDSPGAETAMVEQYRSLCLLALGRTDEAQRALERLVIEAPLYRIPEDDVSPRVIELFRGVRTRMLPDAARALYASAKAGFDEKQYGPASSQFAKLLGLLADPDMAAVAGEFEDMKTLAQGFQQLAEVQIAAEAKARAEAAAKARAEAAAAAAAAAPAARPKPPMIYTDTDAGIRPPVEIQRRMPPWNPPTAMARTAEYRGVLEVIISESGTVDSAILRDPVAIFYDDALLEAAMSWRFQPATLDGQPVKYRKLLEIVHSPR
jgi:hypothetical protein